MRQSMHIQLKLDGYEHDPKTLREATFPLLGNEPPALKFQASIDISQ